MIGEGCHFIDTFAFLIGERPVQVMAAATWTENVETVGEDTATVTVSYADGSLATLAYVANGSDRVPKEHCEVSAEGKTAFSRTSSASTSIPRIRDEALATTEARVTMRSWRTSSTWSVVAPSPSSAWTLVETTLVTFAAVESMRTRTAVAL